MKTNKVIRISYLIQFFILMVVIASGLIFAQGSSEIQFSVEPQATLDKGKENGQLNQIPYTSLSDTTYYIQNALRYQLYLQAHPKTPIQSAIKTVNLNLDHPFYSGVQAINEPDSTGVLCNKYFQLSRDFVPKGLVNMDGKYGKGGRVYQIRSEVYEAYRKMERDASKQNLRLLVVSAYRSYGVQSNLYATYVKRSGRAGADLYSARAGHSEHQTGLALDINATSSGFATTPEFKWLNENAARYGFILRYPKDKTAITGYTYEPWHWRYVGSDIALAVKNSKLTYEEWLQAPKN